MTDLDKANNILEYLVISFKVRKNKKISSETANEILLLAYSLNYNDFQMTKEYFDVNFCGDFKTYILTNLDLNIRTEINNILKSKDLSKYYSIEIEFVESNYYFKKI